MLNIQISISGDPENVQSLDLAAIKDDVAASEWVSESDHITVSAASMVVRQPPMPAEMARMITPPDLVPKGD